MQTEAPALAWAGVAFLQKGPDLRSKIEPVLYAVWILVFRISAAMELTAAALHYASSSVLDWPVTVHGHFAGLVVPVEVQAVPVGMEFDVEWIVALVEN